MKKLAFCKNSTESDEKIKKISNTVLIPIEDIITNPHQPRQTFDQVEIVTLADSIRQHGLLQPISVRYADMDEELSAEYVLIAGERRLRAMKMLSYTEIPCQIIDITPKEAAELAIIENIMRKDLSMFEIASALSVLLTEFELTQEELGKRLSTSQSNIANKLRLLRYTEKERRLIEEYTLTERHARTIIRLPDETQRIRCIHYIGFHALSVKDAETYVDRLLLTKSKPIKDTHKLSHSEVYTMIRSTIDKPLSKIQKRGVSILSEELETDQNIQIIITIPKDTDCFT